MNIKLADRNRRTKSSSDYFFGQVRMDHSQKQTHQIDSKESTGINWSVDRILKDNPNQTANPENFKMLMGNLLPNKDLRSNITTAR
jgi:hypothetical protein